MLTRVKIIEAISTATKKGEVYLLACGSTNPNSRTTKKVKETLSQVLGEDFDAVYRRIKFEVHKICPVCGTDFVTTKSDDSTTCGYACSNVFFKELRHPNPTNYRTICFRHHKKECVVCGENIVVDVHHMDENHDNNAPENLIPLCPTHHKYWHSGHRHLIEGKVYSYIKEFTLGLD